jgi:hypothetical protein
MGDRLQITEEQTLAGLVLRSDRTHRAGEPSREASAQKGSGNLLREFLERLLRAHLDLDHGSAALPTQQAARNFGRRASPSRGL